ncbi:aminotransferase ALD1, chloroplastic-like [Primulina huaijiensis]|uniref:aminotransferase ALD1, chloroplastic-like n=1 Tax=Primulina huaijiensis TaxID=1492673 RepID=UPI003CC6E310
MGLLKKEPKNPPNSLQKEMKSNPNLERLQNNHLFVLLLTQISARDLQHIKKHPDAKVISLGIGDTKQPLPNVTASSMSQYAWAFLTPTGYRGYGAEQGCQELRKAITFNRQMGINDMEVFVSDGAQCDLSRLQLQFGSNMSVAAQDPTFPIFEPAPYRPIGPVHKSRCLRSVLSLVDYYKENAKILLQTYKSLGFKAYGGENAPYLWVHFPGSFSADVFNEILEKARIKTVQGLDLDQQEKSL